MSMLPIEENRPFPRIFFSAPSLYNTHLPDSGDLSTLFCAHLPELHTCIEIIQKSDPSTSPEPLMILGGSGMGKSTFLWRLAIEIQKDPDVSSSWLALRFAEEQYTISTLSELWQAVLLSLAECLAQNDPHSTELIDLKKLLAEMVHLGSKRREEEAFAFLREIRRRRKQGLIFFVDNTDLLLKGLAHGDPPNQRNASSGALWRLRRILGREKGLFWIGSSTTALEGHAEAGDAFRNVFRNLQLLPIDMKIMRRIMLSFAEKSGMGFGISGEHAVKTMERMINEAPERLRVLKCLTGGDPRSVMILCKIFAAGGKGNVTSDLVGFLDHMTPLYKARMENLSEQPRKIAAHLMDAWHPLSAKELAQVSDLPVTTISGQLSRLENWGLVEKTNLPNNRRNGFQISERLVNAWYLMRYASREKRDSFYGLIEFMRLWYSDEEKYNLAQLQSGAHSAGDYPDLSKEQHENPLNQALSRVISGKAFLDWRLPLFGRKIRQKLRVLLPYPGKKVVSSDFNFWQDRFYRLETLLGRCPHAQVDPAQQKAWIQEVKGSPSLGLAEKEIIAEYSPHLTDFQFQGLRQLFGEEKKFLESQLGYRDWEALQTSVCGGQFFTDFPDADLLGHQIRNLFQKKEAVFIYAILLLYEKEKGKGHFTKGLENAMSMDSDNPHFWNLLGNIWQHYAKNPGKAEKAYQKALALDSGLAAPWNHLGTVLQYDLKRSAEAEKAYRQAISLDETFSWPWNNLGNLFHYRLRDFGRAQEAYEKALALDSDNSLAWNNLGNLLHHRLERFDDAEKAYRTALTLNSDQAVFWNNLGNLLRFRLKNYDGAEEAYKKAIALDEESPVFQADLADFLAKERADYVEARKIYEKALKLDGKNAWLWTDLGDLLKNGLRNYEQAEKAYRKAIALNPGDPFPKIGLGNLLCDHLQRFDEAGKLYEEAIELDKEDSWAYAKLARVRAKSGDLAGAEKNYLLVESLSQSETWRDSPAIKGILLQAALFLEKTSEAAEILYEIVRLCLEEKEIFFRLKEQVWECHTAGLGSRLVALMEKSPFSDFLKPFILGLQVAETGDTTFFSGLAPEMTRMARNVCEDVFDLKIV